MRSIRSQGLPRARHGGRDGLAGRSTRRGRLAASGLAFALGLLAGAPAGADELGALVKARYGEARRTLVAQGFRPAPTSSDPGRCARGFEAQCAAYPETEYCAGGGLPRCVFLWRDGEGMLIELRTLGRDDPVVEIVRCRASCRVQRLERGSPRLVAFAGAPAASWTPGRPSP